MLIGVGGCGKQSLTRLAASICLCDVFTIQLTKDYRYSMFKDDIKALYNMTGGVEPHRVVFLMTDT